MSSANLYQAQRIACSKSNKQSEKFPNTISSTQLNSILIDFEWFFFSFHLFPIFYRIQFPDLSTIFRMMDLSLFNLQIFFWIFQGFSGEKSPLICEVSFANRSPRRPSASPFVALRVFKPFTAVPGRRDVGTPGHSPNDRMSL